MKLWRPCSLRAPWLCTAPPRQVVQHLGQPSRYVLNSLSVNLARSLWTHSHFQNSGIWPQNSSCTSSDKHFSMSPELIEINHYIPYGDRSAVCHLTTSSERIPWLQVLAFKVTLQMPSGTTRTLDVAPDEAILDAAERTNVDLPSLCRSGGYSSRSCSMIRVVID